MSRRGGDGGTTMLDERFDVVVVGAGVAGLRAALVLAEAGARVAVVTKDPPDRSSSAHAQGGIAVALAGDDEGILLHEEDTIAAGAGLCDPPAVSALVRDGRDEVLRLIEAGARFDRDGDRYHLTREAAHSLPRILHADGDATGREIVRTLVAAVRARPGHVLRFAGAMATDLLRRGERVAGVRVLTREGTIGALRAGAVLLASGGIGCCWRRTSNPDDATGDGLGLALRAGAVLQDMEFVQFHPTALAHPGAPSWLLTEALRGEGAHVVDAAGRRFLFDDDPRGELAPRDVVARGLARRILAQGGAPVHLDLRHLDPGFVERRFPGIVAALRGWGIDPAATSIPVAPAAHYAMGGILTDLDGRCGVSGLYAAGEVASTGVHGANRLASNSLLEGLVFGARAARAILADGTAGADQGGVLEAPPPAVPRGADPVALRDTWRARADEELGILRDGPTLARLVADLDVACRDLGPPAGPPTREAIEAASTITTLRAVARAALWRCESRGAHFRDDHRLPDEAAFLLHSRQRADGLVVGAPLQRSPAGAAAR